MAEVKEREVVGTKREFAIFLAIIIASGFLLYFLLKDTRQILAATVFLATVVGTLMFWPFRVAIAFLGMVLLLVTRTIDLSHSIEFMNLDVIIFLVGMMVILGLLKQSGFFRWILIKGLKFSRFQPRRLMTIILILAAVMAALVDEVTSILFIATLVLDLCDYFEVNPVNYIISVVLATNLGSSWTVLGNPVGILIALRSGLTFGDFLRWALPVGVSSLICLIFIVLIWQRKDLSLLQAKANAKLANNKTGFLDEWAAVEDKRLFVGSVALFVGVIIFLAFHSQLEFLLGLQHNTLLVVGSVGGAGIAMLWQRHQARDYIQRDVDWWSLVFFMFLFGNAGCLKYVGLTDIVSDSLLNLSSGGGVPLLTILVLWISGFTSAVMDNVVVVASFVPVLQSLTAHLGSSASVLWWALLFGGCYGGNMTMMGSTANIVALGILEKRSGYHMSFGYWIKIGLLASLIPMAIGTLALIIFG